MITLEDPTEARLKATDNPSSGPSLDLKSAEITTIAVLTALRYPTDQLKVHIKSALSAGWSPEDIVEVILQVALYAGLAATETGLQAAQDVFHNSNEKGA